MKEETQHKALILSTGRASLLGQAVAARLDALVQQHKPDSYAKMLAYAEVNPEMADLKNGDLWGMTAAYAAAILAFRRIRRNHPDWKAGAWAKGDSQDAWRVERNQRLLVRLVVKGLLRQEEFTALRPR